MISLNILPFRPAVGRLTLLAAALLLCQFSVAQDSTDPGAETGFGTGTEPSVEQLGVLTVTPDPLPMEELTVIAPRTLRMMRDALVTAEDDVLAAFNSVNNDDEYDIYCRRETPINSLIPVRVCRARFVDTVNARATQEALQGSTVYVSPFAELRYHDEILRQKMADLLEDNPRLYEAMLRYYNLKTDYDSERTERFEDGFFSR